MAKRMYERLFGALYHWSIRVNGGQGFHVLYASLMLGVVFLLNISVVLIIFDSVADVSIIDFILTIPKVLVIACSVAYFALHYSYFKFGDRYQRIIGEYGRGTKQLDPRHEKIVAAYVASSFILLVVLLYL